MTPKKNKILFISNSSQMGGAPLLFLEFLQWFKKTNNCEFIILLPNYGELVPEFKKIAPTYISNFQHDKTKNVFVRLLNRFFSKFGLTLWQHRKLIKEFKIKRINLIYSNTVHNNNTLNFLSQHLSAKILIHAHEMNYVMDVEDRYGMSLRNSIVNSDLIIAVSNASKNTLISRYKITDSKISVVHNGINFNKFKKIGTEAAKQKLGFSAKETIILGVGQPHRIKGVDIFILTAVQVRKQAKNIRFIWLGGDEKNTSYLDFKYEIDKLNANNYIQIYPNTNDTSAYYEASDIFLLTSREESFSLVTVEAGYFSKPVICFEKTGGPVEILENYGFIADYLDINQVSDKIIQWSKEPNLAKSIGEKFNKKVLDKYEQSRMFNQISNIINEQT